MENPFLRRATEQLRDDEAFLSIVSPQPLTYFLKRPADRGTLYDRLVLVRGTPGSGKTTLARLFEYSALSAVLRSTGSTDYEAVAGALEQCGAIKDGLPEVLGCRLPMETDYRDFWEFPYSDALKAGLLFTFIQARAILAWFRHIQASGIQESQVTIVPRPDAGAAIETIGGSGGVGLAQRAREVERAIYDIVGALVAPAESSLPTAVTGSYRPFDVIERIQIEARSGESTTVLQLIPLLILDDAHFLHPAQFEAVRHWLARRELRIARWLIARFDILQPKEALAAVTDDRSERPSYPGLSADRDIEIVLLQNWGTRPEQRKAFRKMARDMAQRYLQKHPLLGPRKLIDLSNLLSDQAEPISNSKLVELRKQVAAAQKRLKITDSRRSELEAMIEQSRKTNEAIPEDLRLAMLSVLLHRYSKRTKGQGSLFEEDPEPSRPLAANSGVYEAAKLQLLHRFDRAFYFGTDDLCDASSENAELFLQLSAILVDSVATQVIRSKPAFIDARTQQQLLRERSRKIVEAWSFPYSDKVKKLVAGIGAMCVEKSLEPNASVAPNAYALRQAEFDSLSDTNQELARVLQFAVAYNALLVAPHSECKGEQWCLLELGGPICLSHGLTLNRGGFLEGDAAGLTGILEEQP